jgi:hypothetical protein
MTVDIGLGIIILQGVSRRKSLAGVNIMVRGRHDFLKSVEGSVTILY